MKTLRDLDVKGKKVLMRVDFNVPLDKEGRITDDTRIREAIPSIKHVLDQGGSVILLSHLGRPKEKKDPALSLAPCAKRLSELLHIPVEFVSDSIGEEVEKRAAALKTGSVLLLENLRFYAAEEKPEKDPSFAQKLAKLGDLYVNDAFGTAHRAHSSTHAIAKHFPGKAAVGFLMEKEIKFFSALLAHPKRPFYAIIGGAKISSKIGVLKALLSKVDGLFIGGAMAYTFLKAKGLSIGSSLYEPDHLEEAKKILDEASSKKVALFLPLDHVIASEVSEKAKTQITSAEKGIPEGWSGVDIGPMTIQEWSRALSKAATIFWNGPLGVFEIPAFARGTHEIASLLASLHTATTIVGGGDSVAAVNAMQLAKKFTHISTGGGASLEYLELGHLPGIDILSTN